MTALRVAAALAASLVLAACDPLPPAETLDTRPMTVVIAAVNPPKHFKVTFHDPVLGYAVAPSISKHCNMWRETTWVGREVPVTRITVRRGSSEHVVYRGLRKALCGPSNDYDVTLYPGDRRAP